MSNTRVKIGSIVQSQLPDFVREEYPLVGEFLKEYYNSLEGKGGTLDVLQNIDQYVKLDNLTESLFSRTLTVNPINPQTYFIINGGGVVLCSTRQFEGKWLMYTRNVTGLLWFLTQIFFIFKNE